MRNKAIAALMALAALVGCRSFNDAECAPCEPGGCPDELTCVLVNGERGVCVEEGTDPSTCAGLSPDDAGAAFDAGASRDGGARRDGGLTRDAGAPRDGGADTRCTTGIDGIVWLYSAPAQLCFTENEITADEFELCGDVSCTKAANFQPYTGPFQDCNYASTVYENLPMNCVRQQGAQDFCAHVGGRLPTEDEWYAEASASGTRMYPWGDERADCTRASMNDGSGPGCSVGNYSAPCQYPDGRSVSGLCDMAGNMSELTSDVEGQQAVVRGGDMTHDAAGVSAIARATYPIDGKYPRVGFRCVRTPD